MRQDVFSFSTPAKDTCLSPALPSSPKEECDGVESQSPVTEGKGWWPQAGRGCSHFSEQPTQQQKVMQNPRDCSHSCRSTCKSFSSTVAKVILIHFTFPNFPQSTFTLSISHRSHLPDLLSYSSTCVYGCQLWNPISDTSPWPLRTIKKKSPKLTRHIRRAWISKEMKTGHKKGVGWRKRWRCNANRSYQVTVYRNSWTSMKKREKEVLIVMKIPAKNCFQNKLVFPTAILTQTPRKVPAVIQWILLSTP